MPGVNHGIHLTEKSLEDLRQLGEAYKDADKVIQKRLRTGLQAAAKPLAERVIREGAEKMPSRGGLRARIASSRPGVTASLAAKSASVSVRITNRQKDAMGVYDSGKIRHPVFGEKRLRISSGGELSSAWVQQTVPSGAFSDAFKRGAPEALAKVRLEMDKALREIAADAT
jgi:hypothetical protein